MRNGSVDESPKSHKYKAILEEKSANDRRTTEDLVRHCLLLVQAVVLPQSLQVVQLKLDNGSSSLSFFGYRELFIQVILQCTEVQMDWMWAIPADAVAREKNVKQDKVIAQVSPR